MGISEAMRRRQHDELDAFTGSMRARLIDEEARGDWHDDDPVFFIPMLLKNLKTLAEYAAKDADDLTPQDEQRIRRDGADCANCAFIMTSILLRGLSHA